MEELTGRIIAGRYRVESFEGQGGMANVYKVWDLQRAVYLAMKVLHSDLAEDRVFLRRFKREAQMLERLQHPNIVRFYGLEESEGLAYILMDYIEGLTLRREIYLNNGGLRPSRILQILKPVCAALHYAHLMGMVHCDIKPVNIILHHNSTVFLADFGIARVAEARTQTALISGTPAYMAPEQFLGQEPTPASDIYALGVVLYEMLTGGERPFTGESVVTRDKVTQRIIWEKQHLEPPPPSRFNDRISPELEAVTLHCLERDPNARFDSTLGLSTALEQAVHANSENDDIQTLVDIQTPSRQSTGEAPFLGIDDDPGSDVPEQSSTPEPFERWQAVFLQEDQAPDLQEQPGGTARPEETPAHLLTPIFEGEWLDEVDAVQAAPAEGSSSRALALTGNDLPDKDAARVPARQRSARQVWPPNKNWILAGMGLFAMLMLGLALFSGRQEPAVSAVSAAATVEVESSATVPALLPTETGTPTLTEPAPTPTLPTATATPAPTHTPLPQPTQFGGSSGKIAFASDRSGTVQIWVMDAGNPDQREQVTRVEGGACQPAWAPDGKQIAFITPCNGPRLTYPGAEIMILNMETGELRDLNLPGSAFDPAWSPDGETIAYTTFIGGKTVIYAVNLGDGKPYLLAQNGDKNESPDWSPNGETIAYIRDNKGVDEIWVMNKDGSSKEMVTQAGLLKYFSDPEWGPDGQTIAAGMKELNLPAPVPVLMLIDRFDGREGGTPLLGDAMRMEDGSFSADGQWLAFWTVADGSNMEILRTNRSGEMVRLTDLDARDFHPDWGWH